MADFAREEMKIESARVSGNYFLSSLLNDDDVVLLDFVIFVIVECCFINLKGLLVP